MRLSRAVSLLMAILLAATMSQALASPSQAMRPTPAADAAKGLTPLKANMVEAGNDHFVVYGVAGVTKVGIFRNSNGGRFFLYRKIKVNKNNGKFRTRVYQYKQHPHVLPRARPGDRDHQPAHRAGRVHRDRRPQAGLAAQLARTTAPTRARVGAVRVPGVGPVRRPSRCRRR